MRFNEKSGPTFTRKVSGASGRPDPLSGQCIGGGGLSGPVFGDRLSQIFPICTLCDWGIVIFVSKNVLVLITLQQVTTFWWKHPPAIEWTRSGGGDSLQNRVKSMILLQIMTFPMFRGGKFSIWGMFLSEGCHNTISYQHSDRGISKFMIRLLSECENCKNKVRFSGFALGFTTEFLW